MMDKCECCGDLLFDHEHIVCDTCDNALDRLASTDKANIIDQEEIFKPYDKQVLH